MQERMTTMDAARALGLSYHATYKLLVRGVLKGERFGALWCIDPASVERFRSERAQVPGRGRRRERNR